VSVAAKIISHGEETNENGTGPVNQLSNDGQGSAVGGSIRKYLASFDGVTMTPMRRSTIKYKK
jgi:hypothetical protein